jgi:F-type H+-transporting ATPase subunit b
MMRKTKCLAVAAICLALCLGAQGLGWCAEDGHGGGGQWIDFVKRLVNFAIMVGLLVWLLKKPVAQYFASRRETIQKTLADLEQKKAEAESQCAEYKAKLAALDKETEKIVAEYVEEGEAERRRIVEEAQKQADYIKQQAQLAISQEIRAARESLQEEIAELSAATAEDILKNNIRPEDQERLIDEFMTKVVEAK